MEIPKLQNQATQPIVVTEEELRMEIFRATKLEKLTIAKILQEDVPQLLTMVEDYVNLGNTEAAKAIIEAVKQKLNSVAFELSPNLNEKLDLLASLKELFTKKLSPYTLETYNNFIRLPELLSGDMQNAIFSISQTMLTSFDLSFLLKLSMDIARKEGSIVITFGLSFNATISPILKSNFIKTLRPLIYMLSGKMVFKSYSENQMELIIFLDEA